MKKNSKVAKIYGYHYPIEKKEKGSEIGSTY
jgi:hypothetical protein